MARDMATMKPMELDTIEDIHSSNSRNGVSSLKRKVFLAVLSMSMVLMTTITLLGEDSRLAEHSDKRGTSVLRGYANVTETTVHAVHVLTVDEMKRRLQPRELLIQEKDGRNVTRKHQFLHLHHMKTAGTSMDERLKCAINRLRVDKEIRINYGNIHECSEGHYAKCKSNENQRCNQGIANASFMSYCAPLKDLPAFTWDACASQENPTSERLNAITVLRNPVERVWSMYRFQTKRCYKCMKLTDIYKMIDDGTIHENITDPLCLSQLQNHETANLLSTEWPEDSSITDQQLIDQATYNMKHFFTVVGLTEQLNTTIEILGHVFPWFRTDVEWSKRQCKLRHENASPQNNHCGSDGRSHWDLPSLPDEETRQAIVAHNQLDLALYQAALEHFELQKLAVLKS